MTLDPSGDAATDVAAARGIWSDPTTEEVAPGVHRIPLPLPVSDGLRAVNVYAIETPDSIVMIDSGWALELTRERLAEGLARIGAGLGDVSRFLVTHMHKDHYSQGVVLRREFGMELALGLGEQPALRLIQNGYLLMASQLRELSRAGAHSVAAAVRREELKHPDLDEWEDPDTWIEDRVEIQVGRRTLTALKTPGHTAGHVIYADFDNSLLFSGDHVLPHITPSLGFEPFEGSSSPLAEYLASLHLVKELPDMAMLPAHGSPQRGVHARVDELVEHHEVRLQQCLDLVKSGARTGYEVAQGLRWTRHERHLSELDTTNQVLAITEAQAHLDVLVARGHLDVEIDDPIHGYRVPPSQPARSST
jgi:glyoxylase-like metal-dependent hydrolase (beta-lactamase superfamily II)